MTRIARIINQVVFVALLAILVVVEIPYGTVDAWWESLFECLVFALTAMWLVEVLLRGSWQIRRASILAPLAILTGYIFFQTLPITGGQGQLGQRTLTIDVYQTYLTGIKFLALTLFTGLLLLHTTTVSRVRWIVRTIVGIALVSAIFGILRQLLQSPTATSGFVLTFLFPSVGYGQFLSANVFAYLVEIGLGLLSGLLLGGGVKTRHILTYTTAGLVILTALTMSRSRGGLLGFVAQFVVVLIVGLAWYSDSWAKRNRQGPGWAEVLRTSIVVRVLATLMISVTVVGVVLWIGGERLAEKQSTSQQVADDGTTGGKMWHATWILIKEQPVAGVGFGAYYLAIPEYQAGPGLVRVEQAHNDYLDLAANGGIIAVGLAVWFGVLVLLRGRVVLRSSDSFRRGAALGAIAAIISVAVHSMVDFGLQVTSIAVLFGAVIVILVAEVKQRSNHRPRTSRVSEHGQAS